MGELLGRWAKSAAGLVLIWLLIFVWNSYGCRKVVGTEMEPTVKRDDMPILDLKSTKTDTLVAGDIVIYEYERAAQTQKQFAGRIVGLPGNRVRIQEGEVYVDDRKQDQSYVGADKRSSENRAEIVVPRNHVYILCDNRREYVDYDSRGVGPIGVWAIEGKVRR